MGGTEHLVTPVRWQTGVARHEGGQKGGRGGASFRNLTQRVREEQLRGRVDGSRCAGCNEGRRISRGQTIEVEEVYPRQNVAKKESMEVE